MDEIGPATRSRISRVGGHLADANLNVSTDMTATLINALLALV